MIELDFISVHPAIIESYNQFGIFAAAQKKALARIRAINLRNFAVDKHGSVDERPYGGGDGMILRPEPLRDAVQSCGENPYVIYTSPHGEPFDHNAAYALAGQKRRLVFVCGRFGGVDQRFIDQYVTKTYSLGNYVVSGGELPALMIADAVLRQVPGVLGNHESAAMDSFGEGLSGDLEAPQYTRPEVFEGVKVPDVLRSGDHEAINRWRINHRRPPPNRQR